jgi:tripartite-type tricarboxylate transporter receptor subunit TctC
MARLLALMLSLLAFPVAALGQAYPAKPIRLVVPYPPGGSTDLLGRTVAQKLSEAMGQQVVVENRPGAGGTIGSVAVARAAPDGYTFLLGTGGSHTSIPFFSKNVPYDALKDFTPLTAAVVVPIALAVHPSVPAATAKEFVDYARKNPGKLSYGSSGLGSPHHLAGELFNQTAGTDLIHVAYKGAGPAMQDLVAGQIPAVFTTLSTALPQMRAGRIKVLGVVEAKRALAAPEVPTIGESVPGYAMPDSWLGFFGPPGLPGPIGQRLSAELVRALTAPDARARLDAGGLQVVATSPEEFTAMMKREIEVFRTITAKAGIKPE